MSKCPCALLKRISIASLTAQTKIVATLVGIIALFYVQQSLAFAAFALICVSLLWGARVSLSEFMRVAKPAAFILLVSFVANTLVFIGHPDIIFSGSVGLSVAGFYRSTVAIARVLLALALVLSVASTTTPTQLADGFSVLLLPLRLIRVDVDGLSIVLSIALRAIPLTLEELDKIRAAQRARGFNFESGSIVISTCRPDGTGHDRSLSWCSKTYAHLRKNAACRLGSPAVVDRVVHWACNTVALQYLTAT